MYVVFVLFYGSFLGIVLMLVWGLKGARAVLEEDGSLSGHTNFSTIGASVLSRAGLLRKSLARSAKLLLISLARGSLDWLLVFYKRFGVVLLNAKKSMTSLGKEKKINSSGNVSDYLKDVLDHKESLRNGNGIETN